MTALPDWDMSDAELAEAAITGDRGAFAEIYDRYSNRLFDFCVGMLRDRESAADCVQDTFCTAAARLSSLRDLGKLRPWLYAIARNEALRRIRERRREQVSDDLPETASSEPGPDALAARTELAALIAQAAAGLSDRDREILDLAYRHGLDGPEIAEALGTSAATTRTLMHRLRETVERSLGAVLVARHAKSGRGCGELRESLKDWDGEFTVLLRKRVARHIESCTECSEDRRGMVNPAALLGAGAVLFLPAPILLRQKTLDKVQLTCASVGFGARVLHSRALVPAALGVAAVALGLFVAWPSSEPAQTPVVESGVVSDAVVKTVAVKPNSVVPVAPGAPAASVVPVVPAAVVPGVPVAPVAPSAAAVPAPGDAGGLQPVGATAPVVAPVPGGGMTIPGQSVAPGSSAPSGALDPATVPNVAIAVPVSGAPAPAPVEPPKSITTSNDTTTSGGSSTTSGGLTSSGQPSGGLPSGGLPSGGLPTLPNPSLPTNSISSGGLTSLPGGLTSTSGGSVPKPGNSSTTAGGSSTTSGGSNSLSSSSGSSGSSSTSGGDKK